MFFSGRGIGACHRMSVEEWLCARCFPENCPLRRSAIWRHASGPDSNQLQHGPWNGAGAGEQLLDVPNPSAINVVNDAEPRRRVVRSRKHRVSHATRIIAFDVWPEFTYVNSCEYREGESPGGR